MSILALTSNTLIGTPAAGNIEYNGQFFGTDSAASRAQMQRIVRATAVTCAGQTSIDFTSLPSWVKKITVMFSAVSTSGTSVQIIQLGTGSTTYTTSGYVSGAGQGNTNSGLVSSGLAITTTNAATTAYSGSIVITNISGNTWVASGSGFAAVAPIPTYAGGGIALGAALTAVRITTVNGTDTFDTTPAAGTINIIYEG